LHQARSISTAQVADYVAATATKDFTIAIVTPSVPNGALGTFIGLIDRQSTVNGNLGGRIDLSTSITGGFLRKSHPGRESAFVQRKAQHLGTGSQISVLVANGILPSFALALSFDGTTNTFNGTLGTSGTSAPVNGWRRIWNKKTNPATTRAGYYTFGLDLEPATRAIP